MTSVNSSRISCVLEGVEYNVKILDLEVIKT